MTTHKDKILSVQSKKYSFNTLIEKPDFLCENEKTLLDLLRHRQHTENKEFLSTLCESCRNRAKLLKSIDVSTNSDDNYDDDEHQFIEANCVLIDEKLLKCETVMESELLDYLIAICRDIRNAKLSSRLIKQASIVNQYLADIIEAFMKFQKIIRPKKLIGKWNLDLYTNGILHTGISNQGKLYMFSRHSTTTVCVFNEYGIRDKDFQPRIFSNLDQCTICENKILTYEYHSQLVEIWDLQTQKHIRSFSLSALPRVEVSFAATNKNILIACDDGKFYLYDSNGSFIRSFIANNGAYFRFFVFNNTNIFVSDCETHCVKVYDLYGRSIRSIGHFSYIGSCALHNDKLYILNEPSTPKHVLSIFDINGLFIKNYTVDANFHDPSMYILLNGDIIVRDTHSVRIYAPTQ